MCSVGHHQMLCMHGLTIFGIIRTVLLPLALGPWNLHVAKQVHREKNDLKNTNPCNRYALSCLPDKCPPVHGEVERGLHLAAHRRAAGPASEEGHHLCIGSNGRWDTQYVQSVLVGVGIVCD